MGTAVSRDGPGRQRTHRGDWTGGILQAVGCTCARPYASSAGRSLGVLESPPNSGHSGAQVAYC